MNNLALFIILAVFIICAYGLNRERRKLNIEQKAKLVDIQSSPHYLLALGIIFGSILLIKYIPLSYAIAFTLWLLFGVVISALALIAFYKQLKKARFPKLYLKSVILYSFMMIFLGVAFLLVLIFQSFT